MWECDGFTKEPFGAGATAAIACALRTQNLIDFALTVGFKNLLHR
ncbi:hypothetical protein [Leptodesmis sp.]